MFQDRPQMMTTDVYNRLASERTFLDLRQALVSGLLFLMLYSFPNPPPRPLLGGQSLHLAQRCLVLVQSP